MVASARKQEAPAHQRWFDCLMLSSRSLGLNEICDDDGHETGACTIGRSVVSDTLGHPVLGFP